jgi:hypothetical protein
MHHYNSILTIIQRVFCHRTPATPATLHMSAKRVALLFIVVAFLGVIFLQAQTVLSSFTAKDPGVRGGQPNAGGPFSELSQTQLAFFNASQEEFEEEESVKEG